MYESEWKEVHSSSSSGSAPCKRWGHKCVTIGEKMILFGGFGGDKKQGQYLEDMWSYDTVEMKWELVQTTGNKPEKSSNFTMSYCTTTNSIIVFGGGGESKRRFNVIYELGWATKEWRHVLPIGDDLPWSRTYHVAELVYPFLIIHGGEGVANIDLDDCWVFNLIGRKWTEVPMKQGSRPCERRFHSSTVLKDKLYIIGGCKGNYQCLDDVYQMDLLGLLATHDVESLTWKLLCQDSLVKKWGHNCEVFEEKIYIFGGRTKEDSNELLCIAPETGVVEEITLQKKPCERRRASSTLIGSCLAVFGGFNGNYLKDFHYINLLNSNTLIQQPINPESNRVRIAKGELGHQCEQKKKNYCQLSLRIGLHEVANINSNRQYLSKAGFFRGLLAAEGDVVQYSINLPIFCSLECFHLLHQFMISTPLVLPKSANLQMLINLAHSAEYFMLPSLISLLEQQMMKLVDQHNFMDVIDLSMDLKMKALERKCSQLFIKHNNLEVFESSKSDELQLGLSEEEGTQANNSAAFAICNSQRKKYHTIKGIYSLIKFDLAQQTAKNKRYPGLLQRTAQRIKIIIQPQRRQLAETQSQKAGLITNFIDFVTSICKSGKAGGNC